MPRDTNSTDPAVTAGVSCRSETVENAASAYDGDGRICTKSTDPVISSTDPIDDSADPENLIIDGKQIPVARTSLKDILHRSDARLRQMLNQNGTLLPEHKLAT
ncbi:MULTISPECIES: hypothetical protein [unclassified Ruminococcus]|uniref:hypothetical protein n=1 Tax=unclassified Ruminococcus TaxID=2608920 RepID=UPI0009314727|nr:MULTISPECIES: hypothetical protein [unclassified Ruminococcus]